MIIPKTVSVAFEGGRTEEMAVHEIKLKDYATAMKVVTDEFALVGLACGRPRTVITELTPASYELVQSAVWEANEKGFFAYAQRQGKLGADLLSRMTPEAVQALGGVILKQQSSALPSRPA
jgi:hypothetical protein